MSSLRILRRVSGQQKGGTNAPNRLYQSGQGSRERGDTRRNAFRELLHASVREVEEHEAAQLTEPFGERWFSKTEELISRSVQAQFLPKNQGR